MNSFSKNNQWILFLWSNKLRIIFFTLLSTLIGYIFEPSFFGEKIHSDHSFIEAEFYYSNDFLSDELILYDSIRNRSSLYFTSSTLDSQTTGRNYNYHKPSNLNEDYSSSKIINNAFYILSSEKIYKDVSLKYKIDLPYEHNLSLARDKFQNAILHINLYFKNINYDTSSYLKLLNDELNSILIQNIENKLIVLNDQHNVLWLARINNKTTNNDSVISNHLLNKLKNTINLGEPLIDTLYMTFDSIMRDFYFFDTDLLLSQYKSDNTSKTIMESFYDSFTYKNQVLIDIANIKHSTTNIQSFPIKNLIYPLLGFLIGLFLSAVNYRYRD